MAFRKRGAQASQEQQDNGSWWRDHKGSPRVRSVALATGVLAVAISPFAIAATGSNLREGVRNGTATSETQVVARIDATSARTGGYSTRQSNLSTSGGGAIYGCRSAAGSTASTPPQNPCIRSNNLSTGQAFEFATSGGTQAGTITVGSGGDTRRPFVTNATGVATGLNADRVDGLNADQIVAAAVNQVNTTRPPADSARATRWALVGRDGQIIEQSGGFRTVTAYPGGADATGNQNVYLDAGSSLEGKAVSATIASQNSTNGTSVAPAADQNFAGEVSAARCQTAITRCAPTGTNNVNTLVVAPRDSSGAVTTPANRKAVYVEVTP